MFYESNSDSPKCDLEGKSLTMVQYRAKRRKYLSLQTCFTILESFRIVCRSKCGGFDDHTECYKIQDSLITNVIHLSSTAAKSLRNPYALSGRFAFSDRVRHDQ